MAGGSAPPGWYADPAGVAGRWRWWDGQQWTEAVRGSDEAAAGQATAEHDLADADLERFTELTAEIACERDAGRSGRMALSVGSRLVGAPAMGPQVACGQGLPDGSFTISVGPDSPRESAEQLVDALGSSLDVVPELQNVHVVE